MSKSNLPGQKSGGLIIADTFTDSLGRLTGDEQKAAKTTAFDLQLNPANPGMSLHKLDRARDKNFWSVRVNSDLRIIVHKSEGTLLLCYVDHHDKAYQWAERRRLEIHPKTGAAQLVELRERIEEVVVQVANVQTAAAPPARQKSCLFHHVPESTLLSYGVPESWLAEVKTADEDTLFELVEHLPAEAAEALLELATGGQPRLSVGLATPLSEDPFTHPDAQRRFRVLNNVEELEQALEYPWAKWAIFLHPDQRQWVERDFNGPARVSGSAGTGKTIVALHRAVYLAKQNPEARVLLSTFSETLANNLRNRLRLLIGSQPRLAERLEVHAMDALAQRLYSLHFHKPMLATQALVRELIQTASDQVPGHGFSQRFLESEWAEVVDAWQLESWDTYRDVKRLGRKTRLPEARRAVLWQIYSEVKRQLAERQLLTQSTIFTRIADKLPHLTRPPFDYAVIDEAQDVSVAQLRFLAALGADRQNGLFFAGDVGQRIFQIPFSWKALGVDIRGRARTLTVNYRTSHQIRSQSDRLLGSTLGDVDGNIEDRRGTVSVFNGPAPLIIGHPDTTEESVTVSSWLADLQATGVPAQEIAVIVRSKSEIPRALQAVSNAGYEAQLLDETVDSKPGRVSVCTMDLAKGLEFRAVAVMACDDEIVPSQARLAAIGDEADLENIYNTERHLLYVACTRARDRLLITGVEPLSEFLDDMR